MFDVACVGVICADVPVKPVDSLPAEGKLELVQQLGLHTGGCAANTAIDLAKLGFKPAILGKIGNDGFGSFIKSAFLQHEVNVSGLKTDDDTNTSASVVFVGKSGERSFLHCLGSNAVLTENDIDFTVVAQSKILFVAGALLLPAFDGEPTARMLQRAREKGIYTVLDTAWDSTGRWMKAIRPCLPHLDLFIPSFEEAQELSGRQNPEDMADVFLSEGVKLIVIKLGKDGCFIKSSKGEKHLLPTYTDIKPVDTTGAGDSFVAGFLAGILKGWDLYSCGKFANAVGTHCIMKVGASEGIKSLDETLEFMKKYE